MKAYVSIYTGICLLHLRYFSVLVMGEMSFLLDISVTSEDFWAMGL